MRNIYINLPVKSVKDARAFYTGLGFTINEIFSDDTAISVVVSDNIFLMLLNRKRFAEFAPRPIADPLATTSALLAIDFPTRKEVDAFKNKALALGGTDNQKSTETDFMYYHSISDPDGHVWELTYMDMSKFEKTT